MSEAVLVLTGYFIGIIVSFILFRPKKSFNDGFDAAKKIYNDCYLIDEIEHCLWDFESVDGITASTVLKQTITDIKNQPSIDAVQVVRCKDCIHRPTGTGANHDLEFPDYVCPCQCEDYYYSWMPKDEWFCKDGERKEE